MANVAKKSAKSRTNRTNGTSRTKRAPVTKKTAATSGKSRAKRAVQIAQTTADAPKVDSSKWNSHLDDTLVTAGFSHGMALIRPSIGLLRRNIESSLILFVLPSLLLLLGTSLTPATAKPNTVYVLGDIIVLVSLLWNLVNALVTYCFVLHVVYDKQPPLLDVYKEGLRYAGRLIGFGLLFILLIVVGFALLIVPGLIVLRRYFLTPFYIVDQDMGIREAMDKSAAQTRPVALAVYGVLFTSVLWAMASYALGKLYHPYGSAVGVLFGTLYVFAPAILYRQLSASQPQAEHHVHSN
jgi:hypothetical protein